MALAWRSSEPADWKDAIEEYQRKLDSGELEFDSMGDIIPAGPEQPGWMAFLMSKLPPNNFSRRNNDSYLAGAADGKHRA